MDGAAPPDPAYPPGYSAETALREELARGDAMLGGVGPVLRHLIGHDDQAIFADDVIARVRGMAEDVARQLIDALAAADDAGRLPESGMLTDALADDPAFLAHLHALALEWRLTQRLQEWLQLDPVLTPLVQALIGSPEPETAALSMNMLAAQARFCNAQRRMKLPLTELPGDLLHTALMALRAQAGGGGRCALAEQAIRDGFDEGASRLGLIARVATGMRGVVVAALSLAHAGAAIFLTSLSLASGEGRDRVALSASEDHTARLVLMLCAAGLKPQAVEEQFLLLHPDKALPPGFERIDTDRAQAILAMAAERAL